MALQYPIKIQSELRGSLERGGNARRHRPYRRSERGTLLRVSANAAPARHTINIWPRNAIALVLNARVQRARIPLGAVARAVHGRCGLEMQCVMLRVNVKHRRMLTAATKCGGGLTCSWSGCKVASDGGKGVPPRNASSVSRRVYAIRCRKALEMSARDGN